MPRPKQTQLRTCTKCKEGKSLDDFGLCRGKPEYWCKSCRGEYRRRHYENNSAFYKAKIKKWSGSRIKELKALVADLKANPCSDCQRTYPPWVMEYDHVRGKKSKIISRMVETPVSKKKLLAEIEKCDLVCSNCHANRTHFRRHGLDPKNNPIPR